MNIQANGIITNTGSLKAIIGAMTVQVSQNLPDGTQALLGSMPLVAQTVQGDTLINASSVFTIENQQNFWSFAHSMIFQPSISWHLETTTTITPVVMRSTPYAYSRTLQRELVCLSACICIIVCAYVCMYVGKILGITLPGIPNIPFSKDLSLNGANGLPGVTLTKFDLTQSTPTQIIALVSVFIPNYSAFEIIPMGDLTFDMYYDG